MALGAGPASLTACLLAFAAQLGLIAVFGGGRALDSGSTTSTTTAAVFEAVPCPVVEPGYASWHIWATGLFGLFAGVGVATLAFLVSGGLAGFGASFLVSAAAGALIGRRSGFRGTPPRRLIDKDLEITHDDGDARCVSWGLADSGGSPASEASW